MRPPYRPTTPQPNEVDPILLLRREYLVKANILHESQKKLCADYSNKKPKELLALCSIRICELIILIDSKEFDRIENFQKALEVKYQACKDLLAGLFLSVENDIECQEEVRTRHDISIEESKAFLELKRKIGVEKNKITHSLYRFLAPVFLARSPPKRSLSVESFKSDTELAEIKEEVKTLSPNSDRETIHSETDSDGDDLRLATPREKF